MKNKKMLIILVIILLLLVVLAGGVIAALYFTTDTFKSNNELFWKYFLQNEKVSSIISNENYSSQQQFKAQNSYTSDGQLIISSQSGENDPQEINLVTTSRHDINTGRTYADISLVKDNNSILKASYINSGDVYSVMCEDIYPYYIGFRNSNLQELAKKWGATDEQAKILPNNIDFSTINKSLALTDAEKQHIYNTYSNVILQSISKEDYKKLAKELITVNNAQYEANKYELTLSGETLKQMLLNCLMTLQADTDTINSIVSRLGTENSEEATNNILVSIDELISDVQDSTMEESLIITVYVQNGKTIRTEVELTNAAKLTIDLTENSAIFLMESYENDSVETMQENTQMQFIFTKAQGQGVSNTLTIVPDINKPEESILLSISLGNVQNNNMSNSYSLTINDADSVTELTYNTQTASSAQVEEIMELLDSNSVIVNNYPLDQLSAFFESLGPKVQNVITNTLVALTGANQNTVNENQTIEQ